MKKKKSLVQAAVLVGILVIVGVVGLSGVFKVGKVEVGVQNAACAVEDSVRSESGLVGGNILFVDENSVKNKLLDKFICIKDVSFKRELPGTMKLSVEGRNPAVVVITYSGNRQPAPLDLSSLEATPSSQSALLDWSTPQPASLPFVADEKGVIFAAFQGEDIPRLFLPEQMVGVGKRLDEGLFQKISMVFAETKKSEIVVSEAVVADQDFLVLSPKRIAFTLKKDISKQLVSLQLILQKAKMDESTMETIDLRFDKPVVKFLPKK